MSAGKDFRIIGAVLILLSTYLLVLYTISAGVFWSGINGWISIPTIISTIDLAAIVYLILNLLFLLAGIIILFGRWGAIIGSIIPLMLGLNIITNAIGSSIGYDLMGVFTFLAGSTELVTGVIPFPLEVANMQLGAILLLAGSIFALLGGILGGESDKY